MSSRCLSKSIQCDSKNGATADFCPKKLLSQTCAANLDSMCSASGLFNEMAFYKAGADIPIYPLQCNFIGKPTAVLRDITSLDYVQQCFGFIAENFLRNSLSFNVNNMANYDYIILSNLGIPQAPASRRFLQAGVIAQPAATTIQATQPATTTTTVKQTGAATNTAGVIAAQPQAATITLQPTTTTAATPAPAIAQPAAAIAQPAAATATIAQPAAATAVIAQAAAQTQFAASDPTLQDPIATSVNNVKLNPTGISVDGSTPQNAANTQNLLTSLSTAGNNLPKANAQGQIQGGQQAVNLGIQSTLADASVQPIAATNQPGTIVFNPNNVPYSISSSYITGSLFFMVLAVLLF